MKTSRCAFAALLALLFTLFVPPATAQQASPPTLQRTAASPLAFGLGASHVLGGFDFNLDGVQDLVTMGDGGSPTSGFSEVRVSFGDNTGAFSGGGARSLAIGGNPVTVDATESALAAGFFYSASPRPGVAVVANGKLQLFQCTAASSTTATLSPQTAPSFGSATLRSVAAADLNYDERADLIVTGSVTTGAPPSPVITRGAVWVVINSSGGFQTPVELAQPGAEAGKLAVGDVNGDSFEDIVVVNTSEQCAKIYLASLPGQFTAAPVTMNAYGDTPVDTRPRAVAIGQVIPPNAMEIVLWNDREFSASERILEFAVFQYAGGTNFSRVTGIGFGLHGTTPIHFGDVAIGDLNNDGRLDIVGTNPVDSAITVLTVRGDEFSPVSAHLSPLTNFPTSAVPDSLTLGYVDDFGATLDVVARHAGQSGKFVDVLLHSSAGAPPTITTTVWPGEGGQLEATGGSAPYTWSLASGTLPPHLALSASGNVTLNGQARENGSYTFTVRATGSDGAFADKSFTIVIADPVAPAGGLVAWWPGENAVNEIISGRHGSLKNGAAFGTGKVGRAFSFDGTNDFVEVADHDSLDLTGDLTIEAWVQQTATSGDRTVVSKRSADNNDVVFAFYLRAGIPHFASRNAGAGFDEVSSGVAVPAGWSHVAATITGPTLRFFINGSKVHERNFPATRPANAGPLTIGAGVTANFPASSPAGPFAGGIDEMALYDRGLTGAEITAIHGAGAAGKLRADAARDFSLTGNPNGVWSYREVAAGASLTTYNPAGATLMTTPNPGAYGGSIDGIHTNAGIAVNRSDTPVVIPSGGTQFDWLARGLGWGVGFPNGERAVLRWTAPAAGRFAVSANFTGADTLPGSTDVHIRHNGTVVFDGTVSSYRGDGLSSTSTLAAAAGDTVDFILGPNGSAAYDTSAIAASVVFLGEALEIEQTEFPEDTTQFGIPWKLTARGGNAPYTFAVVSGELPGDIVLEADGDITGEVAEFGQFDFTVEVTDAAGLKSQRAYHLAVAQEIGAPNGITSWFPGELHPHDIIVRNPADTDFGTEQPGVTFVPGKSGRALQFDGVSGAVEVQSGDLNALPLTIETWIKPELRTGSAAEFRPTNIISGDKANFGGHGLGANVFADGSHLWIELQTTDPAAAFRLVPGDHFAAGVWAHLALVITSGNAKTYVNGALVNDFSYAQGAMDADASFRIGRHNEDAGYPAGHRFFKGAIDELSTYSRALSAAEILAIYNADSLGKMRDDAERDFFTQTNDAGQLWQYGRMGSGQAPVTETFARYTTVGTQDALRFWRDGTAPDPNVIKNRGDVPYLHWAAGELSLHPGPGPERVFSAVRWTAPEAGTYAAFAQFRRLNTQAGTVSVHLAHNERELENATLVGPGARAQIGAARFVQAGDTIDFIVGSRDDFGFDATGISPSVVRLEGAPEPAAVTSLDIQTDLPAITIGRWHFTATRAPDASGATMALQFSATPEVESSWVHVQTSLLHTGQSTFTNRPAGSDVWTFDPHLHFQPGSYYFRVLQTAPGHAPGISAPFGNEALVGGNGAPGPIVVGAVPAPPVATNLKITTAKPPAAGKKWSFQVDHANDRSLRLLVQYSLTPDDPASWQYLPGDAALVRPDADGDGQDFWKLDVSRLNIPGGNVFFRIESSKFGAPSSYSAPFGAAALARARPGATGAIVVKNPALLTIDAQARLQVGANQQDIENGLVHAGEEIAYVLSYRNHGGTSASGVTMTVMVPPQLELVSATGVTTPIRKNPRDPNSAIIGVKIDVGTVSQSQTFAQHTVVARVRSDAKKPGRGVVNLLGTILVESPDFPDVRADLPFLAIADPLRVALRVAGSEFSFPKGATIPLLFTAENKSPTALNNAVASVIIPAGAYVDSFLEDNDTNAERFVKKGRTTLTFSFGTMPPNTSRLVFIDLRTAFDTTRSSIFTGDPSKNDPGFTLTGTHPTTGKTLVAIGDGFSVNLTDAIVRPPQIDFGKEVEGAEFQGRKTFGIEFQENARAAKRLVRGAIVAPGGELTFTLTYRNAGEGTAKACQVFDDIDSRFFTLVPGSILVNGQPASIGSTVKLFNGVTPIGPNEKPANRDLRLADYLKVQVGDLEAGESGVLTYRVVASKYAAKKLKPIAAGQTLAVSGLKTFFTESLVAGLPGQPEELAVEVLKPYEFRLDYKRQPGRARAGNVVRFALKYTNTGQLPAHHASIELPIPVGTTGQSAFFVETDTATLRGPQGDEALPPRFQGAKTLQRFELGTLQPGQTGEVAFYLTVDSPLNPTLAEAGGIDILPYIDAFQQPRSTAFALLSVGRQAAAAPVPKLAGRVDVKGFMPLAIPSAPQLYIGRAVPLTALKGGTMDVTILFGNAGDTAATGGNVAMQIPFETTFVSATLVEMTKPANPADQTNLADTRYTLTARHEGKGANARVIVDLPTLPAHATGCFVVTLKVGEKFGAAAVEDSSCRIVATKQREVVAFPMATQVRSPNTFFSIFESVNAALWSAGSYIAGQHKPTVQGEFKSLTIGSQFYSIRGINTLVVRNGALFASTGFNRALIFGPSRMVAAGGGNLVAAGGLNMVAAGGGNAIGMNMIGVPGFTGTLNAAQLMASIPSLVAAGGGNLVAAGGGNLIGLDGSTLIGNDGSTLIGNDGSTLIGNDGSTLIGNDGSTLTGNIQGASLIGLDGSTIAGIGTTNGKLSFTPVAGAAIVANAAAPMVAAGGGNMVAAGGGNLVVTNRGDMVAAGGGNMVAAGGGN